MFTTVAVIVYGKDQQPASASVDRHVFIAPFDNNDLFIYNDIALRQDCDAKMILRNWQILIHTVFSV